MQLEAAALTTLAVLASVLPCRNGECADWPNWRGINQAGIWQDVRLPKKLEPGNVQKRWSTTIGGGYCGIVVKGRRVLTMDRPADKKSERVVCLDSESGRLLWQWEYSADYGDLDYDFVGERPERVATAVEAPGMFSVMELMAPPYMAP